MPSVIGRRVREYSHVSPTPIEGAYCSALLLAYWSVRQLRLVQLVALYAP